MLAFASPKLRAHTGDGYTFDLAELTLIYDQAERRNAVRYLFSRFRLLAVIAVVLITTSSIFSAQQKEQSPQILKTPFDIGAALSASGYKVVPKKEGLWELAGIKYEAKHLTFLRATVQKGENQYVRVSVPVGFDHSVEPQELKTKLDELNKKSKPTQFVKYQKLVFAVTDLDPENLDQNKLVEAIEKTAQIADSLYSEIEKLVDFLEPSTGGGVGAGDGSGGGIGANPNADRHDSPSSYQSDVPRTVDTKPQIISKVKPGYTDEARQEKIQGVVTLKVLVDETGTPTRITVVRGLPAGLSERAIEAARQTKFKPAMKDGKPVKFWILLDINFNIY